MSTTAEDPMMAQMPPSKGADSVGPPLVHHALKGLIKEAVLEVLHEQRALIGSIFLDAWEDRALGDAIHEERESGLASEDEVFAILEAAGRETL